MEKGKGIRISACVIMRDAAEDIEKCLGSVEGLVDELVVVDTGSRDGSVALAKRLAGKVHEFPWQEDFSLAKNYAIEQATGDWILFLDSDEGLAEESRQNLRPILSAEGLAEHADILLVTRRNLDTGSGKEIGRDTAERIFRRDPALRYRDPIHEYLAFTDGRKARYLTVGAEDLSIWHTGYSPERAGEKSDRNVRMLERMRAQGSGKLYLYYYLAREYLYREEYGKAAEAAEEAIRRGECPGDPFTPYRQLYEARKGMGDRDGMLETLKRGMAAYPLWPDFFVEYGRRLKEEGRLEEALATLRQAACKEREFRRRLAVLPDKVREEIPQVYRDMADICERLGRTAEARSCRREAAKEEA